MREALDRGRLRRLRSAGRRGQAARGKLRGLGLSSYIECTAWGDGEEGSVALEPDGTFTVLVGTQSNGQGHATAYAQTVSQYPRRAARPHQGHPGRHGPRRRPATAPAARARSRSAPPCWREASESLVAQAEGSRRRQARGRRRPTSRSPTAASGSPARTARSASRRSRRCRAPPRRRASAIDAFTPPHAPPTRTARMSARSRSIPRPA